MQYSPAIIVLCFKINTILNKEMKDVNLATNCSIMEMSFASNASHIHFCSILKKETNNLNMAIFCSIIQWC